FDAFGEPSYFVSDSLQETLICAYDPNDKAVFPVGIDSAHYVAKDQELEYLIRFQNTGNDTAFTVIIEDQLPAELNLETFSVEASSHSMEAMVDYDGIASFTFENILLPDSNVDFLGSQGFVKFTIEPVDDLLPNTTISNMASIYFDLNPPIFTNTVFNTVECYIAPEPFIEFDFPVLRATVPEAVSYQWFLDGVIIEGAVADTLLPEFNGEYSVIVSDENDCSTFSSGYDFEVLSTTKDRKIEAHVYPNPFSEYATIKFGENLQGRYDLVICNTLGAQVQSVNDTDGSEILISRNDLGSGIFLAFLIEKATGEKLFIEKLVIQ
ncbi:MAG: T9SS type A sorting domain-containing protein, partial [Cryomorphaceae bacterium]